MKPSDLIIVMPSFYPIFFSKICNKDSNIIYQKKSRIENRTDHQLNLPSADANIILNHQIIEHLSPFYPKNENNVNNQRKV